MLADGGVFSSSNASIPLTGFMLSPPKQIYLFIYRLDYIINDAGI
jgi:hypothetical protein